MKAAPAADFFKKGTTMSDKYLLREDSPFSQQLWERIDETVIGAAKSQLTARRMLSIKGPYGLGLKALPSEDVTVEQKGGEGSTLKAGCAMPLTYIQSEFTLAARDIAAFEQYGLPLNLASAGRAAINVARQEDELVFNGAKQLNIKGLANADKSRSVKLSSWMEIGAAADNIIDAVTSLDKAGFHGPYSMAIAPELYNLLYRRYPQGNTTELEHVSQIITDGIIKSPSIQKGGLILCTCGPFASIAIGQDIMAGYIGPAGTEHQFFVSESAALWLTGPEAVCVIK